MVGTMAKIDDSVKKKIPELRFEGFTDAWEQRKLGEVATLSSSKRIHLSDYVTEGIPFYRGSEISTGGITGNQELFISQEKFDEIKEKYGVPSEGDILVTAVGTLGNLWKVDSRRFYYKDGNLIQISKIQVNSDYLLTYFTGGIGKKRLLDSAAGSNQKALTMVKMREITVDFPSEDEQKKIGAFFKQLDDTITLHQRKLDLLKEQKKGYLQKMFPKNGAKVPELRFAGFADDWEERKLGELSQDTFGGGTPKTSVTEYWNGEIPWIQSSDLSSDHLFGVLPKKHITENAVKNSATKLIPKNSIAIVTRVGVGKLAFMPYEFTSSQDFLSLSNLQVDCNFGMYSIYKMLQRELNNIQGTSIKGITKADLLDKEVIIPVEFEEQKKIGSFFKQLDDTITLHQRKLDLLKEQKKGFLQKMFV